MQAEIPASTYRLQFNQQFTFKDALNLTPYLSQLGISHCYASPLLTARPGSTHGYDIIDHRRLNPEIGTEEEFNAWVDALQSHGIGLILDIVPNHMGIGEDNAWWMDVLEHGGASRYAEYFDIDWSPLKPELAGKVLLPALGEAYGVVLEQGDLQVQFNPTTGSFNIHYFEHFWPVTPQSYPLILRHRLDRLRHRFNMTDAVRMMDSSAIAVGGTEDASSGGSTLTAELPTYSMALLEYESILRSFEQLPPHTERNPQRIQERDHEVMVAKHRLATLYQDNFILQDFLAETLAEFNSTKSSRKSQDLLHQLLEAQVYRLAYWRVAGEEINYRRFFDINTLAGIRVESAEVFQDTHDLILRLIQQGKIQGLRIDHPDGLFDPANYFKRLQTEALQAMQRKIASEVLETIDDSSREAVASESSKQEVRNRFDRNTLPFYVLAEKILAPFENLPTDWAIQGTTGYDFIYSVNELFVQPVSERKITRIYQHFTEIYESFSDILLACKRLTLKVSLASELNVLAHQLNRLSESDRRCRDFTLNGLRRALGEVIIAFPVYRTYLDERFSSAKDREYVEWAVNVAKRSSTGLDLGIFEFIKHLLLADLSKIHPSMNLKEISPQDTVSQTPEEISLSFEEATDEFLLSFEAAVRLFTMKFQQLTGPVMAKSMEDTAFYRYNRFISLNEVGGQPELFGMSISAFHHHNQERARNWPHSMLASSTHDTKRSEDVRARLNVLSETPRIWHRTLMRWKRMNEIHKTTVDGELCPSRNDEYLLYQTLTSIFPLNITDWTDELIAVDIKSRLKVAMQKAVREAKAYTSWINPNEAYETALFKFIDDLLDPRPENLFQYEFLSLLNMIGRAGYINGLSQLVLKLTSPGVPDIYQGMELNTFSLVDPDNRRPVDYEKRIRLLQELEPLLQAKDEEEHLSHITDLFSSEESIDRLKLYITTTTLHLRKSHYAVFTQGSYIPMAVYGEKAEQLIAFIRQFYDQTILVLTSRFWASYLSPADIEKTINPSVSPWCILNYDWKDTQVEIAIEEDLQGHAWKELYTGKELTVETSIIPVSKLLPIFPVAIWVMQ